MRVKDTNDTKPPTPRVASTGDARAPATAAAAADLPKTDKVTVSASAERETTVAEVRQHVGDIRASQMAQIEAGVRNGTHHPNARDIAERIMQAAAFDAEFNSST